MAECIKEERKSELRHRMMMMTRSECAGLTPRSEIPVFVVSSLLQPDDPESNEDDFYFL